MYLINLNWKIVFVITAAFFQFVYPQGKLDHWVQEMEMKGCQFNDYGYRPTGKKMKVTKISPPTVTNEIAVLQNIGGKSKNSFEIGGLIAENGKVVLKAIAKVGSKFAASLGIFGAVFGVVLDQYGTSVDDVIEATNTAFATLTEDVNNRMDQMQAYVDSKILAFERETITCELAILNKFWLNCASEMTTEQMNECQRGAARIIRSSLCKFMLFETQFQKRNIPDPQDLTGEQIRRLEMSLHAFRVYVTLSMAVTSTLAQSYGEVLQNAEVDLEKRTISEETVKSMRKKYLTFLTEEVSDINRYINYAEWSLAQILKVHTNDGVNYCRETYHCEQKEDRYADKFGKDPKVGTIWQCTCSYDKTFYEAEKCVMKILYNSGSGSIWSDGESTDASNDQVKFRLTRIVPTTTIGTAYKQYFHNKVLEGLYGDYIRDLKTSMDNYWGDFLTAPIVQWRENLGVITETRAQFLSDNESDQDLLATATLPTAKNNKKSKKGKKLKVKKGEETKDE